MSSNLQNLLGTQSDPSTVIQINSNPQQTTLTFRIKVTPKSSRNMILPFSTEQTEVGVKITAAPEDNKANLAVISFLSQQLAIPKSKIEILSGQTSRHKQIQITTSDPQRILNKLAEHLECPAKACLLIQSP